MENVSLIDIHTVIFFRCFFVNAPFYWRVNEIVEMIKISEMRVFLQKKVTKIFVRYGIGSKMLSYTQWIF